ncbi:MAG: flavin reductase family protein [Candidatus Izimaplasma sp.]|nr:flavin reductase family protein [Candidatus Izimaplasma bacterium]
MEYETLTYSDELKEMFKQLDKGAFLTTSKNGKTNTMTIAWGGINLVWHKELFVVYVRYTRETYNMLKENDEFTVSIPVSVDMEKELAFCGSKSGRDVDKFKELQLTPVKGRKVNTPIIKECDMHYECKVVYRQAVEPGTLSPEIKNNTYKKNDFHVIYYGEILDVYKTKGDQ